MSLRRNHCPIEIHFQLAFVNAICSTYIHGVDNSQHVEIDFKTFDSQKGIENE